MRSLLLLTVLFLTDHLAVEANTIPCKIEIPNLSNNGDILQAFKELDNKMKLLINRPGDCQEIYDMGHHNDGVYTIFPSKGLKSVKAYCEMNSGFAWTVFLNRQKQQNQITFKRGFHDYIHGFGNLTTEHWLGLDTISEITSRRNNKLRIEATIEQDGQQIWGEWDGIRVYDLQSKYSLHMWRYNKSSTMLNVMDQRKIKLRLFGFKVDFHKQGEECGASEFMCQANNICIPIERKCDHISDCEDNSDERDCPIICNSETRCPKGDCFTYSQRCDGETQCNEGKDENDCDNRCSFVYDYLCNTGQCLKQLKNHRTGDGHPDCTDYTDEQILTNKASNGTGGFWFHHTNYIYPTDEYDSEFFTIAVNEGGVQVNKKLSAVKYMISPYQPPLHSVFKRSN